jgi:hypothetical protein
MQCTIKTIISVILIILCFQTIFTNCSLGCKDLVAVGTATAGDYNLLLKVRDPSRPGFQILTIIPKGYTYTYYDPQTGRPLNFMVNTPFIGVTTVGDTIPNIIKPGMAFSAAGLAYSDADTLSNWVNTRRYAWDDFDLIRYTCEQATTVDEAVSLMTTTLIDELHATEVSENLFIVGPEKAAVIEADAYHYATNEFFDGIVAMSNYPKELWDTQLHNRLPIASSFDSYKETKVRRGTTVHLQGRYGIRIMQLGEDYIVARQVPFFKVTNKIIQIMGKPMRIEQGTRVTVGDYSVTLLGITGKTATISIEYTFKAWENTMIEYMQANYGEITVNDMMNWSRFNEDDLDGLRPMCEDLYPYEGVMIYNIPKSGYELYSSGWFSANHACSSIYIPVHICDTDIYDPYENGEAAQLSLDLFQTYGHDYLTSTFQTAEAVFLCENDGIEDIARNQRIDNGTIAAYLTICDMGMQQQAWLTEQLWYTLKQTNNQELAQYIASIWKNNYSHSLQQMSHCFNDLQKISDSTDIQVTVLDLATNICETRVNAARALGKNVTAADNELRTAKQYFQHTHYSEGFTHLQTAYVSADIQLTNQLEPEEDNNQNKSTETLSPEFLYVLTFLFVVVVLLILIRRRRNWYY